MEHKTNLETNKHYNFDWCIIKEDNTVYYDEPVDAAFEMICWLKKYNKL